MRMLVDGFGEQAALVKAHIAWRRADESGYGKRLGIFRHIKALQRDAQRIGKLARHFGFAHACAA